MKFDFIFFDSGGTLYNPKAETDITPMQVYAEGAQRVHSLLLGFDLDLEVDLVQEALAEEAMVCRKKLGSAYTFLQLLEAVIQDLGLPLGSEEAACLADAYAGPRYASWLFPGTQEALRTLNENGCRMGIIANTAWPGFCMDRAFAGVGLLPYFGIRIYSGDIGIKKPDPAIFRLAEKMGGLEGKRVLYVGNDLEADIKGASAVGWSTAFRRADNQISGGLADLEFDDIMDLVAYCLGS